MVFAKQMQPRQVLNNFLIFITLLHSICKYYLRTLAGQVSLPAPSV